MRVDKCITEVQSTIGVRLVVRSEQDVCMVRDKVGAVGGASWFDWIINRENSGRIKIQEKGERVLHDGFHGSVIIWCRYSLAGVWDDGAMMNLFSYT